MVYVGDIKPIEWPISSFLDYLWAPEALGPNNLSTQIQDMVREQLGDCCIHDVARLFAYFSKYNSRRKSELLDENRFDSKNYDESCRAKNEFDSLRRISESVIDLPPDLSSRAYF